MLDNSSAANSQRDAERLTQSDSVGEGARHLSYEELQAYFEGRVPSSRLSYCSNHLDSCLACRAELEDLRTLKSRASGLARSEPLGRELERRRKRRRLIILQSAALAIIFATALSTAIWWGRGRPLAKKVDLAAAVARPASMAVAAAQAPRTSSVERGTASPTDARSAVAATIQHGESQPPTSVGRSRKVVETSAVVAQPREGFELIGPFGEAIAETRPEFHWTPLAGAIRYSVAIVDVRLHPVQRSHALRTTSWRPRRPLRRGRTYIWQVTATLRGGSKVVASGPFPAGALLRINET